MRTPSPNYPVLVELLNFHVNQAPDMEVLYRAAINEISGLREKLSRQSTMLAEALKEKNEALRRESSTTCTKDALKKEHEEQLVQIRLQLPIRFLHVPLIQAVKGLVAQERKAQEDLKEATELLDVKTEELDERLKELEKLRPSEPKFRVGQVVHWGGQFLKIFDRKVNAISPSIWEYKVQNIGWQFEEGLKALTDEER
jgi:hypothetical protein